MVTGKQLGKIAAHMRKPIIKARKGDICLSVFTRVSTNKEYETTCRDYYCFCIVAHCDRAGRVIQVQKKGNDPLYPAGNEVFMVPEDKCHGLNLVHYLGAEEFNTPHAAIAACEALFAAHNVAEGIK